ncbi:MAG: hypothetical protein JNJ54_03140 [Myxococcaceae bacterium]|nr:hypothetical protein [Myxococcaceae bacterium]
MEPLWRILSQPDNIPIALMVPLFAGLLGFWWRTARRNDALLAQGGEAAVRSAMDGAVPEGTPDPRVHTWPYLLRIELIAALVVTVVLLVWSIVIDAPLEQLADAARTPNPSKAPWYFLGLQELLVYFDPWIAGVLLPVLIIFGLSVIPYVDVNPAGSGFHAWRQRRFAVAVFLFGFVGLWLGLILVGTFCRGPGWNWFWPWEAWDRARAVPMATRNWADVFGISSSSGASAFGALTVLGWYGLGLVAWWRLRHRPLVARLGTSRFAVVAFLLLTMLSVPLKMALRLGLSVKYVWTTPWFNV